MHAIAPRTSAATVARISQARIADFFARAIAPGATTYDVGKALEDLICYVFEKVPGIEVSRRNVMNPFNTEEIDVAFFNSRSSKGFFFLPEIILAECKNWNAAVGSEQVSWFDRKVEDRGLTFGVLVAANGITGNQKDCDRAHAVIAGALPRGRRMILLTRAEIEGLASSEDLVRLFKEKLCDLAVMGRIL